MLVKGATGHKYQLQRNWGWPNFLVDHCGHEQKGYSFLGLRRTKCFGWIRSIQCLLMIWDTTVLLTLSPMREDDDLYCLCIGWYMIQKQIHSYISYTKSSAHIRLIGMVYHCCEDTYQKLPNIWPFTFQPLMTIIIFCHYSCWGIWGLHGPFVHSLVCLSHFWGFCTFFIKPLVTLTWNLLVAFIMLFTRSS